MLRLVWPLCAVLVCGCESRDQALESLRPQVTQLLRAIEQLPREISSWNDNSPVARLQPPPCFGDGEGANAIAVHSDSLSWLAQPPPSPDIALGVHRCLRPLATLLVERPSLAASGFDAGDVRRCAAALGNVRYVLVLNERANVDPELRKRAPLLEPGVREFETGRFQAQAMLLEVGRRGPRGGFTFTAHNSLFVEGRGRATDLLHEDLARQAAGRLKEAIQENVPGALFCE